MPRNLWSRLAAAGAAALLVPAVAFADPPPWANGHGKPDKPGKSEVVLPAPGAAPVATSEDPAPAPVPAEEPVAPDAPQEPAPEPPAAKTPPPPGRAPAARGKGRAKDVVFLVRGRIQSLPTGETADILVTGGNRRSRLKGATITVRPAIVVVDDVVADLAATAEGDRVVFQLRLPRATTAADVEGTEQVTRRLIDVTVHEEVPADPTGEPAPAEEPGA